MRKLEEEIINKKITLFKRRDINIEVKEINSFLENVFFKYNEKNEKSLMKFLDEDNFEEIIQFLMSDALINPRF